MRGVERLSFAKLIKTTNAQYGSCTWSRGRSFAASVPSDSQHPRKGNRKIPREERLAMVEDFVEKYMTANAGKFPSTTLTRQQVGGSHHTIKVLIQMLECKNKLSLLKKGTGPDSGEPIINSSYKDGKNKSPSMVDAEDASDSKPSQSSTSLEQFADIEINTVQVNNMFETREPIPIKVDPSSTTRRLSDSDRDVGEDLNNHATTNLSSIAGETVRSLEASNIEDASTSVSVCIPSDHAQSTGTENVCQEHSAESEVKIILGEMQQEEITKKMQQGPVHDDSESADHRDTPESMGTAEPLSKKQTVWSNLKSLADGILSFWKKL